MNAKEIISHAAYKHTPIYNSVTHCECGEEWEPGHLADAVLAALRDAGLEIRKVAWRGVLHVEDGTANERLDEVAP